MKVVVKVKVSQSLVSYESVLFTVFISNTKVGTLMGKDVFNDDL